MREISLDSKHTLGSNFCTLPHILRGLLPGLTRVIPRFADLGSRCICIQDSLVGARLETVVVSTRLGQLGAQAGNSTLGFCQLAPRDRKEPRQVRHLQIEDLRCFKRIGRRPESNRVLPDQRPVLGLGLGDLSLGFLQLGPQVSVGVRGFVQLLEQRVHLRGHPFLRLVEAGVMYVLRLLQRVGHGLEFASQRFHAGLGLGLARLGRAEGVLCGSQFLLHDPGERDLLQQVLPERLVRLGLHVYRGLEVVGQRVRRAPLFDQRPVELCGFFIRILGCIPLAFDYL